MDPRTDHQARRSRSRRCRAIAQAGEVPDGADRAIALVVPAAEVEDWHAHLRVPRFQIGEVPVRPVIGVIEPVEVERRDASERGLVTKRHPRQRLAPVLAPPLAGVASGLRPGNGKNG